MAITDDDGNERIAPYELIDPKDQKSVAGAISAEEATQRAFAAERARQAPANPTDIHPEDVTPTRATPPSIGSVGQEVARRPANAASPARSPPTPGCRVSLPLEQGGTGDPRIGFGERERFLDA